MNRNIQLAMAFLLSIIIPTKTETGRKKMENIDIQEQAKIIRREGKILERVDMEDEKDFCSVFFIEYEGSEWFVMMRNGEVTSIKKLWKIED
jgi:hypothetical protein